VNVVGTNIGQCPNDSKFEALYNEKVQYFKWGVLTQIINDNVGTKVGTRSKIAVGRLEM